MRTITIIVLALIVGCSVDRQIIDAGPTADGGVVADTGVTDGSSVDSGVDADVLVGDARLDSDASGSDGGDDAGSDSGSDSGADSGSVECIFNGECHDGIACTDDACQDGVCVHTTRNVMCDDGNMCNGAETCDATEGCVSDGPLDCNDGNACTSDSCDPATGCESEPIACDDGNACTSDSCDPATGCVTSPVSCDDGDACTAESCDPASGCSSSPVSCDDGNPCTADSCDAASGCSSEPVTGGVDCSVGGSSGYCDAGTCKELRPVVEVSAGNHHTCVRRDDGTVWCWGALGAAVRSLGDGSAGGSIYPVKVVGIDDAVQVEAGGTQMCAIRNDGSFANVVSCWGNNYRGQVGSGSFTSTETTPVDVSGIVNAADLALGEEFSCVLNQGSTDLTQCWGENLGNQLGNAAAADREASPVWADASFGVEVDSFGHRTCVIRPRNSFGLGEVWCWGHGDAAYNTGERATKSLAVGNVHRCRIIVDSTPSVRCSGSDDYGQRGVPSYGTVSSHQIDKEPVEVVSGRDHACVRHADETVYCWGRNHRGQVGVASSDPAIYRAEQVMVGLTTPLTAVDISAGAHHTCAVEADGTTWCWGENNDHQLGRSTLGIDGTRHSTVPLEVTELY